MPYEYSYWDDIAKDVENLISNIRKRTFSGRDEHALRSQIYSIIDKTQRLTEIESYSKCIVAIATLKDKEIENVE